MTTFIDFVPSNVAPFQFQAVLDGSPYNCVVPWSLFGRRYYVSCYSLDGTLQFTVPLIGSPGGIIIETLEWDNGEAIATTVAAHGYAPGTTIRLAIVGAAPAVYNGTVDVLILGVDTFSWPLAENPGDMTAPGAALRNISLSAGYFDTPLIYRQPNTQFEIG